jgi:hypothetical protein
MFALASTDRTDAQATDADARVALATVARGNKKERARA